MYNKSKILTAATSLVGFRADDNPIYATLSAALKASNSGYYANDLPAVNFEMIAANLSDDQTDANTYLTNLVASETIALVDRFVQNNKQKFESRELLTNQSITSGVASFNDKVIQNERFVGYWIRPAQSNNLEIEIKQLGFQSTVLQNNLKIYLYITSQLEPVKEITFDVTKASSLVWQAVTSTILEYESENYGTGQNYLLGYYEKDTDNAQATQLQGQALYMQFDCNCSNSPGKLFSKYLSIYPIEINNDYLNWNASTGTYDIPLVDNIGNFVTNQTYGLTAKINVKCDITTVLVTNITMFAKPLQHAIASRILFDAYASTIINPISDSKRTQAKQFAIKYDGILNGYTDENGNKISGLIDLLNADFSGLDRFCLKCNPSLFKTANLVR